MYQNTVFDPSRELRLWDDNGELLGFGWLEEPAGVVMQVHPRLRGSGVLEDEMLDWAVRQVSVVYGERAGKELWTRVPRDEPLLGEFLFSRGFERDPYHALKMLREIADRTPQPTLPADWTVCEVGGKRDWGEHIETHRGVWHPSRVTLAAYRRVREAPVYDPQLDLVKVGPDGTFGSYCLCWFDPTSRAGLFESPSVPAPLTAEEGLVGP